MANPRQSACRRRFALCIAASVAVAGAAYAQPVTCEPYLLNNGIAGPTRGENALALASYKGDLYLGQASPAGQDGFALMRRVGNEWKPVGGGLTSPIGESLVSSLVVYDPPGPPGELLIAAGIFEINGVQTNIVAWDGQTFIDIYEVVNYPTDIGVISHNGWIRSLAVFDPDGAGLFPESLVAVGSFDSFQGNPTLNQRIRWDGTAWHPMYSGGGPGGPFTANYFPTRLVVVDADGAGPGGSELFMLASDNAAMPRCMSRWESVSAGWSAFGGPFVKDESAEIIWDLAVFDPDNGFGIGERLVAAGTVFGTSRVASYDASALQWSGLPGAPGGIFNNSNTYWVSLAVFDPDGAGPQPRTLFMGRGFEFNAVPISSPVYAFSGQAYSALYPTNVDAVRFLKVFDDLRSDSGLSAMYLSGMRPTTNEGVAMRYDAGEFVPAAADDGEVFALPQVTDVQATAMTTINSSILGVAAPTLVIATRGPDGERRGGVRGAPSQMPLSIWDGEAFYPYAPCEISNNFCCNAAEIRAMAPVDPDGLGPLTDQDGLAVVGQFDFIDPMDGGGPVGARGIAIWDGSVWHRPNDFGSTADLNCVVYVPILGLGAHAEGIFVGGSFASIGGAPAANAALWDPVTQTWNDMKGGLSTEVYDAVVFDPDGPMSGDHEPALYVANRAASLGRIVKWNGSTWVPLADNPNSRVNDLQLWDRDGPGGLPPAMIAAGTFGAVGGNPAPAVAVLDESGWLGLGNAPPTEKAYEIAVLDPDGSGPMGEQVYAVLSDTTSGATRFAKLRFLSPLVSVWENSVTVGAPILLPSQCSLATIDDDADGGRGESIIIAGELLPEINSIATRGLIRLTSPNRFLVDEVYATLNGAGAYLCGTIAGAGDDVLFDYTAINGNPDTQAAADLISDVAFGSVSVESGHVTLDLFDNAMTLVGGTGMPSLLVGNGRAEPVSLRIIDPAALGASVGVSASDVVVSRAPTPYAVPQTLSIEDTALLVAGGLHVSPEGVGGSMIVRGSNSLLDTLGDVSLAEMPGTDGELLFVDAAQWTHFGGGDLEVARAGTARLDVDAGSDAMTFFSTFYVGNDPGSSGTIDIGENAAATWTQTGGTLFIGHQGAGTMKVRNTSTFNAPGAHLIVGHVPGSSGHLFLEDAGLPHSSVTADQVSVGLFGGDGLVTLDGGEINATSFTIGRQGMLKGVGTIRPAALLTNQGLISPGLLPLEGMANADVIDELEIDGNYTQVSAPANMGVPGRLAIDLDVQDSVPRADSLNIHGLTSLGGQLDVAFVQGFVPQPGEFTGGVPIIVSSTAIQGTFDVANFPGLPPTLSGEPRFLRFEHRATARGSNQVVIVEETLTTPPPAPAVQPQEYDIGGAGTDAALADLNGDGLLDLAITIPDSIDPVNNPGAIILLFNGGSSFGFWTGFTSSVQITVARNPSSIVIADFDGVLGHDIAFASRTDQAVHVLLNDGAGNFNFLRGDVPPETVTGYPLHLMESDFNLDGGKDLAVVAEETDAVTVMFNSRPTTGSFTGFIFEEVIPIPTAANDGTPVDIDNDKWDDIVLPDDDDGAITVDNNGPTSLRGGPVFNPVAIPIPVAGSPVSIDAADLDLDGFNDVALGASAGGTVTVLLGNGTNTFLPPITIPAGTNPGRLALIDLDHDNDSDVAVITTNDAAQRVVRVIRNDLFGGQLAFAPQEDLAPGATPQLVLGGDVTSDGNADLVTVNESGGVRGGEDNDVSVFTFAACRGDANNDRVVDMKDISATLVNFLHDYRPGTGPGDADGSGVVDFRDITAALRSWGRDCR